MVPFESLVTHFEPGGREVQCISKTPPGRLNSCFSVRKRSSDKCKCKHLFTFGSELLRKLHFLSRRSSLR